jgi:tRNA A37 threonylcarbamoyladenosine dehydratase
MDLSAKFVNDVVAVIGLGGTGAYVLDFLVKTPVREIRAFDLDVFHVHNAFRPPGRLDESELGKPKTCLRRSVCAVELADKTETTYVVANNHNLGKAAVNALELISMLEGRKVPTPSTLASHYPKLKQLTSD